MARTNNTKPLSSPLPQTPSDGTKAPNFEPPPTTGGGSTGTNKTRQ